MSTLTRSKESIICEGIFPQLFLAAVLNGHLVRKLMEKYRAMPNQRINFNLINFKKRFAQAMPEQIYETKESQTIKPQANWYSSS